MAKDKTYTIKAHVSFDAVVEVSAHNEEEAIKLGLSFIEDGDDSVEWDNYSIDDPFVADVQD